MFGVLCFSGFGRDTGPFGTHIVVSSIVQETQTQIYNVIFFVCLGYENKQLKVLDSKTGMYTTLHGSLTSSVGRVVKSHELASREFESD